MKFETRDGTLWRGWSQYEEKKKVAYQLHSPACWGYTSVYVWHKWAWTCVCLCVVFLCKVWCLCVLFQSGSLSASNKVPAKPVVPDKPSNSPGVSVSVFGFPNLCLMLDFFMYEQSTSFSGSQVSAMTCTVARKWLTFVLLSRKCMPCCYSACCCTVIFSA